MTYHVIVGRFESRDAAEQCAQAQRDSGARDARVAVDATTPRAAIADVLDCAQSALASIAVLMDRTEWTADTLDGIANILRAEGFAIRDPQ